MANLVYNRFLYNLMIGNIDLSTASIYCALLTSSYTPDKDHNVWSDVSGNEVVGVGYTSGGKALSGKSVSQDDSNDKGIFLADNLVWTDASFTARYAVLYNVTDPSELICLIDFGSNKVSNNQDFNIIWDTESIFTAALVEE